MQTLTEVFDGARLLVSKGKSHIYHFDGLAIAGITYHGTLVTKKGGEYLQGRDKWKAEIHLHSHERSRDFHGYGATKKEALADLELATERWAEQQEPTT